jgi:hypothetical protein
MTPKFQLTRDEKVIFTDILLESDFLKELPLRSKRAMSMHLAECYDAVRTEHQPHSLSTQLEFALLAIAQTFESEIERAEEAAVDNAVADGHVKRTRAGVDY